MTALDTTNLRLAITVPGHGYVTIRMRTVVDGATTFPGILLGVMNGATIIARVQPSQTVGATALATTRLTLAADFTIPGLTPGAMNIDAAYGVEVLIAATAIQYGGPNDATANTAWGAFVFEAWDPQPLPVATPGAAGGLLISGTNAGTTTLGALTVTGAMTVNGTASVSQTGDAYARIGANGASLTAVGLTATQNFNNTGTWTGNVVGTVSTLTTYTGNTPQTGDAFSRIGAAGVGLTNIGDARMANLDTTVSSRSTYAGADTGGTTSLLGRLTASRAGYLDNLSAGAVALASTLASGVTVTANNDKTGYSLTQAFPVNFSALGIGVSGAVTASVSDKTGFSLSTAGVSAVQSGLANAGLQGDLTTVRKILQNAQVTDTALGTRTVYDDDGTTPLLTARIFNDSAGTRPYNGASGINRTGRLG